MTQRDHLLRAAALGLSCADAATIAASFSRIKPDQVERYCRSAEEAAYALLDAIAEARMAQRTDFFPVAASIIDQRPTRRIAA